MIMYLHPRRFVFFNGISVPLTTRFSKTTENKKYVCMVPVGVVALKTVKKTTGKHTEWFGIHTLRTSFHVTKSIPNDHVYAPKQSLMPVWPGQFFFCSQCIKNCPETPLFSTGFLFPSLLGFQKRPKTKSMYVWLLPSVLLQKH